jgi:signal peptidase II
MGQNLIKGLGLAAIIAVLDQISKWWVTAVLMQPPENITILPFFNIVLAYNRGVSFGLFPAGSETGKWILIGLTSAITIVLIVMLARAANRLNIIAFGLIIGGAVGNITDRVIVGAVVDFLDFHAFGYHWPAFNVADSAIFIGAGLLIIEHLFIRDEMA